MPSKILFDKSKLANVLNFQTTLFCLFSPTLLLYLFHVICFFHMLESLMKLFNVFVMAAEKRKGKKIWRASTVKWVGVAVKAHNYSFAWSGRNCMRKIPWRMLEKQQIIMNKIIAQI